MSEQNLTPEQRQIPKRFRAMAYARIPMTCDRVREILDEAKYQIMKDCEIDPADEAIVDESMSAAFQQIRDEVTQPFRTEQMQILQSAWNTHRRAKEAGQALRAEYDRTDEAIDRAIEELVKLRG